MFQQNDAEPDAKPLDLAGLIAIRRALFAGRAEGREALALLHHPAVVEACGDQFIDLIAAIVGSHFSEELGLAGVWVH